MVIVMLVTFSSGFCAFVFLDPIWTPKEAKDIVLSACRMVVFYKRDWSGVPWLAASLRMANFAY